MLDPRAEKIARIQRLEKIARIRDLEAAQADPDTPTVPEKSLLEKGADLAAAAGREAKAFILPGEKGGGSIGENFPIVGPLGRRAGEGFRALVEGGLSSEESIPQAYDRIRAQNDAGRQRFAEEHPVADVSHKLLGGIGGAGALPVLGAGAKGVVGMGGRIIGAAGTEAADAALADRDVKKAATVAGGLQAGLEAVPIIGKYARPLKATIDKAADWFQSGARERAVKAALGNNDKAWKELGRGRIDETGRVALDKGIVQFGSKAGKIADRAQAEARKTWGRVEKGFDDLERMAEESGGGSLVHGEQIAQKIEEGMQKIPDTLKGRARKKALAEEAQFYREKGVITPREAQELKGDYVFKFEEPHLAAIGRNGTNMVNRAIGESIKDSGSRVSNFAEDYTGYGAASTLHKGAEKTHRQLTKNRNPFSLTDYLAGGTGASAAAWISGDPTDAMLYGFLSGQANKLMRTRGNAALAVSMNSAAKALKSGAANSAQILRALESGALGGRAGHALAHQIMLQQKTAEDAP